MNADLEWLKTRWGLPAGAEPAVMALLRAESEGSTACEIDPPACGWGHAAGGPDSPLVLADFGGRTYLQSRARFAAEKFLAERLVSLAASPLGCPPESEELFPAAKKGDRQVAAARLAASSRLAIITGGPGTGKTYTLARAIALLLADGTDPRAVRLAAPTGKAAQRMKTAISEAAQALPPAFARHAPGLEHIAGTAATLHSLLGYNPDTRTCRALPGGTTFVLDECSMIDASMWAALFRHLPEDARLVLIGDPNQLESVGQGNTFSVLASHPAFDERRVRLTAARRFENSPAIQALADAISACDASAATLILEERAGAEPRGGVAWLPAPAGILAPENFPPRIVGHLEDIARAETPEDALDALGRVCVLTAQRDFFVGSKALASQIAAFLSGRAPIRNHPIIIDRNDPETRLKNGTVGILRTGPDGSQTAFFRDPAGGVLRLPASGLPDHSPAWALTIHRSQGSEYGDVFLILPRESSPLATRELVYTGITRAKNSVYLAGELSSLAAAASRPSTRVSLLPYHLPQRNTANHFSSTPV